MASVQARVTDATSKRVWIVGHCYLGRRWCEVQIREPNTQTWQRGFIWAEWNAPASSGPLVPRLPSLDSHPMSNVDPLVFGPYSYFDYCRKGRKTVNLEGPNQLAAGDLVIFAVAHQNKFWIDTVFAIGATRSWPRRFGELPDWGDPGPIALRTHFHDYALRQHREVYDGKNVARSYRGARDLDVDPGARFAWVPWSSRPARPMQLAVESVAYGILTEIYGMESLLPGFQGSFAVTRTSSSVVQQLYEDLTLLARAQDMGIAAEVALVDDREDVFVSTSSSRNRPAATCRDVVCRAPTTAAPLVPGSEARSDLGPGVRRRVRGS